MIEIVARSIEKLSYVKEDSYITISLPRKAFPVAIGKDSQSDDCVFFKVDNTYSNESYKLHITTGAVPHNADYVGYLQHRSNAPCHLFFEKGEE